MNSKKDKIKMINDLLLGKKTKDLPIDMDQIFFSLKRRGDKSIEEQAQAFKQLNPGKRVYVFKLSRRGED